MKGAEMKPSDLNIMFQEIRELFEKISIVLLPPMPVSVVALAVQSKGTRFPSG